jgi:uncharacterized membrane protein YfcA
MHDLSDLNSLDLSIFLAAAFAASLITGLAGFAFGIIAAGPWLHVLSPAQTTALIVAFGLVVQGYSVWKLRAAIRWPRLLPFLIGSAAGVPFGVALLHLVSATHLRIATGAILVAYSLYGLLRPKLPDMRKRGRAADAAVGFFGGVLGGATGLAGILVTIWSGLRGWPKDEQRAVFQPTGVATFLMIGLWLGGTGLTVGNAALLFVIGLPAVLLGTWAGLRLYGRLDEAGFRKIVLGLLLMSGATLIV